VPNLCSRARFKGRTMFQELKNLNWIRNVRGIDSDILLEEFVMLFKALSSVVLSDQKDEVVWRWTEDGKYTVTTTYECQFLGTMIHFLAKSIWRGITGPKCKFFAWLFLHDRVLTTHNLIKRGWPCSYTCTLCSCLHETTKHLLIEWNFTEAV
jgi:hypothetical protein